MPTREGQLRVLVGAGLLPSAAFAVLDAVEARGGRMLTMEEVVDAALREPDFSALSVWFLYSSVVPTRLRRLWFAETVPNA